MPLAAGMLTCRGLPKLAAVGDWYPYIHCMLRLYSVDLNWRDFAVFALNSFWSSVSA